MSILSAHINDYALGEVIGVGTVGTIYAAIDKRSQEKVAIKKLHPGICQDALVRARFAREALIMERLHHPHIVRSFGGGDDHGQLFYVMEVVGGGTVKDLLQKNGAFEWPIVVEIGRQVCSALQFAHNHGVIHRDLKPSNLFLTQDADVKLGDFGIARDLQNSDITSSGMTVGTHAYMAPEQITGDASISGKADLYSLGCCLFEMLTGRTPFQGKHFAELFDQHLRSDPPSVRGLAPDCPIELETVVMELLAKNPDDRPFNARQVQAIMLKLGERASGRPMEPGSLHQDDDVSADQVASRGRLMLRDEIQDQIGGYSSSQVSGLKLVLIVVAILAVILAATFLAR